MGSQAIGAGNSAAIQQAERTELRKYLPADLKQSEGKALQIKNWLAGGDRQIKSINYAKSNALESVTIVTSKETISMTEMIQDDKYFVRLKVNSDQFDMAVSGDVGSANLELKNMGGGAVKSAVIQPGFAEAQFKAALLGEIRAKIK